MYKQELIIKVEGLVQDLREDKQLLFLLCCSAPNKYTYSSRKSLPLLLQFMCPQLDSRALWFQGINVTQPWTVPPQMP